VISLNLGPLEIAFIIGVVLLLFGPDKVPSLARSVGKATREYQRALKGLTQSGETVLSEMKGESVPKVSGVARTSASEDEHLLENARKLGIETEGKTIEQVVDEILKKTG